MSTGSLVPALIDALVAIHASAAGIDSDSINDGPGASAPNTTLYAYVGVDDPDADDEWVLTADSAPSGENGSSWPYLGHAVRAETVSIPCVIAAVSGDADQQAARNSAYAAFTSLTTSIETDPTLGVPDALYVVAIGSHMLQQRQSQKGAEARIRYAVQIEARP